jgi:uncharacterized protein GlcG (DUF336 family)
MADHNEPDAVVLHDEITEAVNNARADGVAVAVAYVDRDGRPHLSLRGTVHAFSPDELAFWARTPGLPTAVATNPHIALLYQHLPARTFYCFEGRARIESDADIRDAIFAATPEDEQAHDPDRHGTAVVVSVDAVDGRGPSGHVRMRRAHDLSVGGFD